MRPQSGAAGTLVLVLILIGIALWWFKPWEGFRAPPTRPEAAPRAVDARGTLTEDEQTNITVFKTVSPSVVHITTLESQRGFFSTDVTQVPRGTGTGFMWDDHGNVVTNFHVIQGASGARVTLSDQSTWKAALGGHSRTATSPCCESMRPRKRSGRSSSAPAATFWSARKFLRSAIRSASIRR